MTILATGVSKNNPLADDLNHILTQTKDIWEEIRGKSIFITGGTGFFGCWFLEGLIWANEKLNLNASVLVLTRNYDEFKKTAPHLAENSAIKFHIGDVRNFDFPKGEFPYIIHAAATSARATFNNENPLAKFNTIVEGTRHTLDFAVKCAAKKFLFTSSGAVYGKQPSEMTHISEDYNGAPNFNDSDSVWGTGKRTAELLCAIYSEKHNIETKIARCFTFVGPYLPLDIHYAIGNFISDRLKNKPITIQGDGASFRSYLYAADLVIWLWTILFRGENCRPYNVGSEEAINIYNLAKIIAKISQPELEVNVMQKRASNKLEERYVPSTKRVQNELGLKQIISLEDSIKRTIKWNKLREI
ncbi:NAD-dependent epimerase/dehydratase family protein [Patescibacteria group bacterium]|nr:NAD-dependent epimerase/dehydratase family protein [Patescibacteria group bacterium]